jgi:hypothetical protein
MELVMNAIGERVAHLEATLGAHSQDLNELRQRDLPDLRASVARLEDKMERRFELVDRRFDSVESGLRAMNLEMHTQFRWLIAGMAGAALTVVVAIFAKELIGR